MDLDRRAAFLALEKIFKGKAYSNLALNSTIAEEEVNSQAFVRELVYGVIKNKIYLDYILNQLIKRGVKSAKREPLILLELGLYQIIFLNSVPPYAAINETVTLTKVYANGREGFVNGVLRGYLKNKDNLTFPDKEKDLAEYLATIYSYKKWIIEVWLNAYGEEKTLKILEGGNKVPDLSIRVNTLKTTRDDLVKALNEKGFQTKLGNLANNCIFVTGSGLLDTDEYKNGLFSVQDEASITAINMLSPNSGDTVIDVCAAPGGKTLAMAEKMKNTGRIIACDIYDHKLKLIENEAERLGINIVETKENDGSVLKSEFKGLADKVLVDGPCSGLGVVRRKPEIKYKDLEDKGLSLSQTQITILETSSHYVKEGGYLLYSTCTINPLENHNVVEKFLLKHKEYKLVEEKELLPGFDETDGFFICKMKRIG